MIAAKEARKRCVAHSHKKRREELERIEQTITDQLRKIEQMIMNQLNRNTSMSIDVFRDSVPDLRYEDVSNHLKPLGYSTKEREYYYVISWEHAIE